jgi:hypothetical protein
VKRSRFDEASLVNMSSIAMSKRRTNSAITKTQSDSHAAWQSKLDASIECLRLLLSPSQANSKAWKPILPTGSGHSTNNSVANIDTTLISIPSTSQSRLDDPIAVPSPTTVKIHKRSAARGAKESTSSASGSTSLLPPGSSNSADIFRAVCHVPLPKQLASSAYRLEDLQDAFRSILATPECRPLWDHMVEESEVIEELDSSTRISRTIFRLGWPASHRDAITISRNMMEGQTLMDVSTSLPRSPDAPAYLRPAPPYVRSHVNLFAWCLQPTEKATLKVSLFWSWDLKGAWLGMPSGGLGAQLPTVVTSLVSQVVNESSRVPYLASFGRNVEVTLRKFDPTRDMISVEYQVISEPYQEDSSDTDDSLVWGLPAMEGWDVHISIRPLIASATSKASTAWTCKATREKRGSDWTSANVTVRIDHGKNDTRLELEQGLRGSITIQRIAASQEVRLRLNDSPCAIEDVEAPNKALKEKEETRPAETAAMVLEDSASVSGLSLRSDVSSQPTVATINAEDQIRRSGTPSIFTERILASPRVTPMQSNGKTPHDRSQALTSLIRRSYIYFTSLLQEPEAKWRHHSDSKGVTITQLDSIDPTLVVYRAEATFVGVSVWDIFATIGNPGVKSTWDKGAEETTLVEDLGDASKLWWTKIRAAWPVSSRDNVTIETSYQSPSSIHIFSFSTDDRGLFPSLPKIELGTIRTQVDLRGWSIESLSPTTVHITLIEQSDPKGWTSKSQATPSAMASAVAGVGDFAIKRGSPPITTRLLGAKTKLIKYDHDQGTIRLEYELASGQAIDEEASTSDGAQHVECEIRCDLETWASGLDLVVDPPPINVSCLRRHKLSMGGSGLWLTIEHVAASLEDDLARITVRKASSIGKEKGVVHVNGARIKVDVIELGEEEVASLKDRKRTKPKRVPLDLINGSPKAPARKRNVGAATTSVVETVDVQPKDAPPSRAGTPSILSTSQDSAPSTLAETNDVFSDERPRQPMTCALDVLFLLRRIHAERGPDPAGNPAGWSLVSQRNGLFIRRRMMQSISQTIHVQRGDKVVEGLTAEDILSAISSMDCRKLWDEKVDSSMLLESFGNGANTGFFTSKASFPFRGRAFHLASLTARSGPSSMNLGSAAAPTVYFHASASYPERNSSFSPSKVNPTGLPLGKVLIDGWILETLDPYSSTLNYQIPSTRCTHVVAVDYAGSLPIAVNTMWNSNLPRSILAIEEFVKKKGTLPSIRSPPACVVVLGDGRDEDRNLIWNMEDDKTKRSCTLLVNSFNPLEKVYSVLVKVDAKTSREAQSDRPNMVVPFPRRAATPVNGLAAKGTAASPLLASAMGPSEAGFGSLQGLDKLGSEDQEAAMSRTTSVTSLRSITKKRSSVLRTSGKKPVDLVLLDVEVELRHYERGYEVVAASEWGSGAKIEDQPMSLHAAPESAQDLPLRVASYDLPPSAVLAATLDPSARPRKHLLRVTLPTAALFPEARDDPFSGPEPDDAPKWYQDLRDRGACIRLTVRPLGGSKQGISQDEDGGSSVANSEIDSQQVPVVFQGKKLPVTHVNQTSAMLQRESEKEEGHARLKRVSPSHALKVEAEEKKTENILDDRLPALLQYPLAAANELKKVEGEDERAVRRNSAVEVKDTGLLSTATSTTEMGESITPTAKRTVDSGQLSSLLSSPAATPLMGILSGYPLSRMGASTAVTTAVANGGVFSRTTNNRAKDRLQSGANVDSNHTGKDGDKKFGSFVNGGEASTSATRSVEDSNMPGNLVLATTENIRKRLSDLRFTLSTLILVAIIAFLFGSLIRSLIEPADFIFVDNKSTMPRSSSQIQDVARSEMMRLLEGSTSSQGLTTSPRNNVVKRELKRLIQLRGLGGWELVIAAARW